MNDDDSGSRKEDKVLNNDILMYMFKVYFMEDKCYSETEKSEETRDSQSQSGVCCLLNELKLS